MFLIIVQRGSIALKKWNSKWQASSIDISQKYIYLRKYENKKTLKYLLSKVEERHLTIFALHIYALNEIGPN